MTIAEAAWLAALPERTIRALIEQREIALVEPRVGRQLRIHPDGLAKLARSARAAYWLDQLLAGAAVAPRAARPWQRPAALPPVPVTHTRV